MKQNKWGSQQTYGGPNGPMTRNLSRNHPLMPGISGIIVDPSWAFLWSVLLNFNCQSSEFLIPSFATRLFFIFDYNYSICDRSIGIPSFPEIGATTIGGGRALAHSRGPPQPQPWSSAPADITAPHRTHAGIYKPTSVRDARDIYSKSIESSMLIFLV
jgi:hypothetical protein